MSEHTKWEAVDEKGEVVGTWIEWGPAHSPEWIRECRDRYHPGTRLRVIVPREPVTYWDEVANVDPYCPFHGDQPTAYEECSCDRAYGILYIPEDMKYDPESLKMQVWTTPIHTNDLTWLQEGVCTPEHRHPGCPIHSDTPSTDEGSQSDDDPWPGLDN